MKDIPQLDCFTLVCEQCGSTNMGADAHVSLTSPHEIVGGPYDAIHCFDCEQETEPITRRQHDKVIGRSQTG
jgi:hypothetical protein